MTLITDRTAPADVPTTNALDSIPADLLGPIPAEIRLGSSVLMMMDEPPSVHDVITVVMRLRVKDEGKGEGGEGGEEIVHYRRCKVVTAWLQGERPPTADDEAQPSLFEESGSAEPEALGDLAAKIVDAVESGVRPPQFSNLTGSTDE